MSRQAYATPALRHAPRATLNHIGHEMVLAETTANIWGRQNIWDRRDWWLDYLERLRDWHWAWVRHRIPDSVVRCPDCLRVQQPEPGLVRCFNCRTFRLVNG
jgi:hypothetical protein